MLLFAFYASLLLFLMLMIVAFRAWKYDHEGYRLMPWAASSIGVFLIPLPVMLIALPEERWPLAAHLIGIIWMVTVMAALLQIGRRALWLLLPLPLLASPPFLGIAAYVVCVYTMEC